MTVRERLLELAGDQSVQGGPELLPVRLTKACTEVLPIAGAGLSLYSAGEFRVPIGASDDTAAFAERLQFTLGEGPCLQAHAEEQVIAANESAICRAWPRFHQELVAGTGYRSIVSVPLKQAFQGFAALDLYLTSPNADLGAEGAELESIAEILTANLLDQPQQADTSRGGGPMWLDSPSARRRSTVWGAIGMINVSLHLTTVDALAVLRGYSFSHDTTVDDIAAGLVSRRLSVEALFQDR